MGFVVDGLGEQVGLQGILWFWRRLGIRKRMRDGTGEGMGKGGEVIGC